MTTFQENYKHFNEFLKFAKIDEEGHVTNADQIEFDSPSCSKWIPTTYSQYDDFHRAVFSGFRYRLKPQPEYVHFDTWEEIFENAYNPEVIWVKILDCGMIRTLDILHPDSKHGKVVYADNWYTLEIAFNNIQFFNPLTKETKPFGKLKV